ncbi:MAG: hypothetical protein ACTSUE_06100 [Promethearchaeota archaeon]
MIDEPVLVDPQQPEAEYVAHMGMMCLCFHRLDEESKVECKFEGALQLFREKRDYFLDLKSKKKRIMLYNLEEKQKEQTLKRYARFIPQKDYDYVLSTLHSSVYLSYAYCGRVADVITNHMSLPDSNTPRLLSEALDIVVLVTDLVKHLMGDLEIEPFSSSKPVSPFSKKQQIESIPVLLLSLLTIPAVPPSSPVKPDKRRSSEILNTNLQNLKL